MKCQNDILRKVRLSIMTKNYENAAFYLNYISPKAQYIKLLIPIMFYENGEYCRALTLLSNLETKTAFFYKGLCLLKAKKINEGIEYLAKSVNKEEDDSVIDPFFDSFFVYNSSNNYIYEIIEDSIKTYSSSILPPKKLELLFEKNFSVSSFLNLLTENKQNVICEIISKTNEKNIPAFFLDFEKYIGNEDVKLLEEYKNKPLVLRSLFLASLGQVSAFLGEFQKSKNFFIEFRRFDPGNLTFLDNYSSLYRIIEGKNNLGLLAKEVLDLTRNSHIVWIIVGNYFSKNLLDSERSAICYKRSIKIKKSDNGFMFLGYEYLKNKDYTKASRYFFESLKINRNSCMSYSGLALIYSNTKDTDGNADLYFEKALEISSGNKMIQVLHLKNLVESRKFYQGLEFIFKIFSINLENYRKLEDEYKYNNDDLVDNLFFLFVDVCIALKFREMGKFVLSLISNKNYTYFDRKCLLMYDNQNS